MKLDELLNEAIEVAIYGGIATDDPSKEKMEKFVSKVRDLNTKCGCDVSERTMPFMKEIETGEIQHAETVRYALREVVECCPISTAPNGKRIIYSPTKEKPKIKLWCVCPEMSTQGRSAHSEGGETSGGWKYREESRKAGEDVPFGGCVCQIIGLGEEMYLILDKLTMAESS